MNMKKGFTLIEIMIVIGIVGILATIGVPKLFVSVAKAKAAEIPVASGSYKNLQDTYVGEKTVLGSWNSIGYTAPGKDGSTSNFSYGGDCFNNTPVSDIQSNALGWKAISKTALTDCPANSIWAITLTAAAQNSVEYKQVTDPVNCLSLVSNWSFGGVSGDCTPTKSEAANSVAGDIGATGSNNFIMAGSNKDDEKTTTEKTEASGEQQSTEPTYVKCGSNGHASDSRCCNGKNDKVCNCGAAQMKEFNLVCQ